MRGLVRTNSGRYVRPEEEENTNKAPEGHVFWDQIKRSKRRQDRKTKSAVRKAMKAAAGL